MDVKHHVYIFIQIVCRGFNIDSKRHGFNTDRKQIGTKKHLTRRSSVQLPMSRKTNVTQEPTTKKRSSFRPCMTTTHTEHDQHKQTNNSSLSFVTIKTRITSFSAAPITHLIDFCQLDFCQTSDFCQSDFRLFSVKLQTSVSQTSVNQISVI